MFLLQDHYDTIDYFNAKIGVVVDKMENLSADDLVIRRLLLQSGVGVITAFFSRHGQKSVREENSSDAASLGVAALEVHFSDSVIP